ncbi:hypothetical protein G4177_14370 [Corallococcus sp. ZKHCc1 1396]|uniref:Uncharacterized protein n=1 Tax=Corallococcus soli TaxID=2710757 RepID=A0ABR9PNA9_9BACT|nr:hypothetical protein [Corallococcus soli]MBE4749349.1 hypothetical protein [Corallococcus soli]
MAIAVLPPAGMCQLMDHGLGSALLGQGELAPVKLRLGFATGLGALEDEPSDGALASLAIIPALLLDVVTALHEHTTALELNAFPEAGVVDVLRRRMTVLDRWDCSALGVAHGRAGWSRGRAGRQQQQGKPDAGDSVGSGCQAQDSAPSFWVVSVRQ